MNLFRISTFILILFLQACSKGDLVTSTNEKIFLDDLLGKWTLINYWADWCPPCIKEIPELNELSAEFSDDVNVYVFNFDRLEGDALNEQLLRFGVKVPSLITDPELLYEYDVPEALPVSFIIDKNGKLFKTLKGPQTKESFLKAMSLN
ncbi:TlpA family protein disulfide reductase [SAR86 cluster bacterium]|nr:TlpA family protein disulfide reductase [SAR86 cluster bacterium]